MPGTRFQRHIHRAVILPQLAFIAYALSRTFALLLRASEERYALSSLPVGFDAPVVPERRSHDGRTGSQDNASDDVLSLPVVKQPAFIIIGAQKSGTDSLYWRLGTHANLTRPKNEIHFFDNYHLWPPTGNGGSKYRNFTDEVYGRLAYYHILIHRKNNKNNNNSSVVSWLPRQLYFEKSPDYLFNPYAASRMVWITPWVKLIALLRDPVDRAFSQWKMNRSRWNQKELFGETNTTFDECVTHDIDMLAKHGVVEVVWGKEDEGRVVSYRLDPNFLEGYKSYFEYYKVRTPERVLRLRRQWKKMNDDEKKVEVMELCDGLVGRGLYGVQLIYYAIAFKLNSQNMKDRLLVLDSRELLPKATGKIDFKLVTEFLGVENIVMRFKEKGGSIAEGDEVFRNETRVKLQQFFQPFNKLLYHVVGEGWEEPWEYDGI